ncbi:MAG TPA: Gfo/Idh/MocA family oxidoreductase [Bacteroidales bacterium]|nr:Gfo/Idh/MocA family oxidoreductase [Bacteroidales bacterium]
MNRTVKWGILGTGNIAHQFARGLKYSKNAELFAVGSRNNEKAKIFATTFAVPNAYGSYNDLVNDADVDVIYIATPHNLHFENTMMCLEHGKHVLCEKPFAVNTKEVQKMIDTAREKNLFLMEALWTRFLPHIEKAKELIASGAIGELKLIKADFGFQTPYNEQSRIFNKQLIGGSLLDVGIYTIFFSLFFAGKPKQIKAVAGMGPTGIDHNCSMSFLYESDLVSVLYSSVVAQTGATAEIHGTKGKILFNEKWFTPVSFVLVDDANKKHTYKFKTKGNGYNYEADEATRCILAGKIESEKMSWGDSLTLIQCMDEIRKQCNIIYPDHDKQ